MAKRDLEPRRHRRLLHVEVAALMILPWRYSGPAGGRYARDANQCWRDAGGHVPEIRRRIESLPTMMPGTMIAGNRTPVGLLVAATRLLVHP